MRLFLALTLSDAAEIALERIQARLKIGRLTPPDQFHVTLAFLGDVEPAAAEELHDLLSVRALPPVTLEIGDIGHFGRDKPRLIYAGVTATDTLKDLQAKVAQTARTAGITVERRKFVPHVTLARLPGRIEDAGDVAAFAATAASFRLPPEAPRHVTLFRSHLRPEGPIYEMLETYPLG